MSEFLMIRHSDLKIISLMLLNIISITWRNVYGRSPKILQANISGPLVTHKRTEILQPLSRDSAFSPHSVTPFTLYSFAGRFVAYCIRTSQIMMNSSSDRKRFCAATPSGYRSRLE